MDDTKIEFNGVRIAIKDGTVRTAEIGWWNAEGILELLAEYGHEDGKHELEELCSELKKSVPFDGLKRLLLGEIDSGAIHMWSILFGQTTLNPSVYMATCSGASSRVSRELKSRITEKTSKFYGRPDTDVPRELAPVFKGIISGCTGYAGLAHAVLETVRTAETAQRRRIEAMMQKIWEREKVIMGEEAANCR